MSTKKKVILTIGLAVLIGFGVCACYLFISNICRILGLYPNIIGGKDLLVQLPPSIIALIFSVANIIIDVVIMVRTFKHK